MTRRIARLVGALTMTTLALAAPATGAPKPAGFPIMEVDTQAGTPGAPAIEVGGDVRTATGVGDPRAQVVTVRRDTGLVSESVTFGGPGFAADVESFVTNQGPEVLVIVSSQPGWGAPTGLGEVLESIGVVPMPVLASGGSFSAIGVPGAQLGMADQRDGDDGGRIIGGLVPDSTGKYAFVTTQYSQYRFGTDTLTIDGFVFPSDPVPGGATGGFHVWALDEQTLEPTGDGATFATNGAGALEGQAALLDLMANIDGDQLLFVRSFGDPVDTAFGALDGAVAIALAEWGATATFLNQGVGDYTLVGWDGAGEAGGVEATETFDSPSAGASTGILKPTHEADYRPLLGDPSGTTSYEILDTVYGDGFAADWPAWTAAEQAAYAWVSGQVHSGDGGPDLRANYWQHVGWTWSQISDDVHDATYPGASNFTAEDLARVQAQLHTEIGWVETAKSFFYDSGGLLDPFQDAELSSWSALGSISEAIRSSVGADSHAATMAVTDDVLEGLMNIGWAVLPPPASEILGTIGSAYTMGVDVQEDVTGTSGDDPVTVAADALGSTLSTQLSAARTGIQSLYGITVSDYGRLEAIGTRAECTSGPQCTPAWQWSDNQPQLASGAVLQGMQRGIFQALVPAKFVTFDLRRYTISNARSLQCLGSDTTTNPFSGAPDAAQSFLRVMPGSDAVGVLVLADSEHDSPDSSLTGKLFGGAASGGMGLVKERFMLDAPNLTPYGCRQVGDAPPPLPSVEELAPPAPAVEPPPAAVTPPPAATPSRTAAAAPKVTLATSPVRMRSGAKLRLRYRVDRDARVTVRVYRGKRLVATERRSAREGSNRLTWDGRWDVRGRRRAEPGRYTLRIEVRAGGKVTRTARTLVVR